MRSATAPEISAGVIAANMPRKATVASVAAVTGDVDVLQEQRVEAADEVVARTATCASE